MKRLIVWIMVLSFLNLSIMPTCVMADEQDEHNKDLMESGFVGLGIGLAVGIVVVGVIYLIKKASKSKDSSETTGHYNLVSGRQQSPIGFTGAECYAPSGEDCPAKTINLISYSLVAPQDCTWTSITYAPKIERNDLFARSGEIVILQW